MAEALYQLGSEAAWLVHGQDGMDEITTTAATDLVMFKHGMMNHSTLTPEEFSLPRATLADLRGENAEANAVAIKNLFHGAKGAYRDIVAINAAAAMVVAGKVDDMRTGLVMAGTVLDSGAAQTVLEKIVRLTNGHEA
jgi:anthranilate phosphoribosyltransferase